MAPTKPSLKPVKPDGAPPKDDLAAAGRVLSHAAAALNALAASLDGPEGAAFVRAVDRLESTRGRIIVSGMGKSGHIARKVAATLSSTGAPACFIHPAEAGHGDLGMVTRQDVLLVFSWGGETAELAVLIRYAKRFGVPLIGASGNADSTLMQAADVKLLLPRAAEACPNGLAPTTSTTMMLALGDALAVALMERRGFSPDQYRDLHPGGSLGRALLRVADLMHRGTEVPLVRSDAAMREVIVKMTSCGVGFAGVAGVVDENGALIGIVTDGDVRRHVERDLLDRTASQVMTRNPKTVAAATLAVEALAYMNAAAPKVTSLFVIETAGGMNRPVGVITVHDCLRAGLG